MKYLSKSIKKLGSIKWTVAKNSQQSIVENLHKFFGRYEVNRMLPKRKIEPHKTFKIRHQ